MIDRAHKKFAGFWLAVAWIAASSVSAGNESPPGENPTMEELSERILAEERDRELRVVGLHRIRVSFPQRVSASIGAILDRQPSSYECVTVCKHAGFFFQAEPGYSGGALSAGYAVVMGEKRRNERFLSRVYVAYGVRAALLRTWNDADLRPSDQTLLGVEGNFTVIGVNFSLGLFRPLGSTDPDDPWVVAGGIGWGF